MKFCVCYLFTHSFSRESSQKHLKKLLLFIRVAFYSIVIWGWITCLDIRSWQGKSGGALVGARNLIWCISIQIEVGHPPKHPGFILERAVGSLKKKKKEKKAWYRINIYAMWMIRGQRCGSYLTTWMYLLWLPLFIPPSFISYSYLQCKLSEAGTNSPYGFG